MIDAIQIAQLRGGLHLRHGPIDLLLHAEGSSSAVAAAYANAARRFESVLADLVKELPALRSEMGTDRRPLAGDIARRMFFACRPYRSERVTPMAAVAGAVADHMLAVMNRSARLTRAWVNNGGDIAFSLGRGQRFRCGLAPEVLDTRVLGHLDITERDRPRGIATSGRATQGDGGRSFSLGIADAVTVLARDAASADAAATLIANQVDLPGHDDIERQPAIALDPDSDLGERLVTTGVARLPEASRRRALDRGAGYARELLARGRIDFAVLFLQQRYSIVGDGRGARYAIGQASAA